MRKLVFYLFEPHEPRGSLLVRLYQFILFIQTTDNMESISEGVSKTAIGDNAIISKKEDVYSQFACKPKLIVIEIGKIFIDGKESSVNDSFVIEIVETIDVPKLKTKNDSCSDSEYINDNNDNGYSDGNNYDIDYSYDSDY